jgi:hypothetical protein
MAQMLHNTSVSSNASLLNLESNCAGQVADGVVLTGSIFAGTDESPNFHIRVFINSKIDITLT